MVFWRKERKDALVFVDYEYWATSVYKLYRVKPDIKSWITSLREQYNLKGIYFFADFFRDNLKKDVPVIREFTNHIIETQCTYGSSYLKDMSDFIMLDFMYRAAYQKNSPPNFIVFTGDGHFQSVIRLLVQDLKKNTVVYGIRDSFSHALKDMASTAIELPDNEAEQEMCRKMIVMDFDELAKTADQFISFTNMIRKVSSHYRVAENVVELVLHNMIQSGLVVKSVHRKIIYGEMKEVKVLVPQWDKLIEAGLYSPPGEDE